MAPTSNAFRASRPLFNSAQFRTAFARSSGFRPSFQQTYGRRFNSTTAETAKESLFSRMWNSPVGFRDGALLVSLSPSVPPPLGRARLA